MTLTKIILICLAVLIFWVMAGAIFNYYFPDEFEEEFISRRTAKRIALITPVLLALILATLLLLPSEETRQTFITGKIGVLLNDNTLLLSERDMLLKQAATLQKKSSQEDGSRQ